MSTEENKMLAHRSFEEIWNKGNMGAIEEMFVAMPVYHGFGMALPAGRPGIHQFVTVYRTAFPDTHFTIEDQVAEGDRVLTRWTAVGTHQAALMGIPPTGKRVSVTGM